MEQTLRVWFTVFQHSATKQSIAWLGPFGLVYIAVSDLCVTSIKLLSQAVTGRSDSAVQANPNSPSQAINCLIAGRLRIVVRLV